MKLFALATCFIGSITALAGQLSNVQNQRLQFDLAEKMEHRHMIMATIAKINRMPLWRRESAMHRLQDIVRQLQAAYKKSPVEKRQDHRYARYANHHR